VARKQQKRFARLRVMAEYGSSGVWSAEPGGPFRHGMVGHARPPLPEDLAARFDAGIARYWLRCQSGPPSVAARASCSQPHHLQDRRANPASCTP